MFALSSARLIWSKYARIWKVKGCVNKAQADFRAGGAYSLACIFVAFEHFSLKTKSLEVENCLIPLMLDYFFRV